MFCAFLRFDIQSPITHKSYPTFLSRIIFKDTLSTFSTPSARLSKVASRGLYRNNVFKMNILLQSFSRHSAKQSTLESIGTQKDNG